MTTKIVTTRPSFQGDLVLRRIDVLPAGAKPVAADGARHILAHSETGHHHVIEAGLADRFIDETNAFIGYLAVNANAAVEHLRSFDTHESLLLTPGIYEIRQQREYVPEGFRRVAD
jgi:hypothetical protein